MDELEHYRTKEVLTCLGGGVAEVEVVVEVWDSSSIRILSKALDDRRAERGLA